MAETDAPPRPARDLAGGPDYDADFFLWTQRQAELIRQGRFELVDWPHVAEEIEDMGRNRRRALEGHLEALMLHLLKWQFQPLHRSRSWQGTIRNARRRVQKLLDENPSLRGQLESLREENYPMARTSAAGETGAALSTFPERCPYSVQELLDDEFHPGGLGEE